MHRSVNYINDDLEKRGAHMIISLWRTFLLFITVTVMLRFMGKRQIGELQPSELVTTIMISNIAAIPIENINSPIINCMLAIIFLSCMEVLLSALTLKFRRFRGLAMGHPRCVIRDGKIDEKELRALRWSLDDLMELMRTNGIFDIDEVLFAIVETNGSLSTYSKYKNRTVTNGDIGLERKQDEAPPVLIISDGEVDKNALKYCDIDEEWLRGILLPKGLSPCDLFMMSCDRNKKYRMVLKEKR